jgi:hypothetical protein
VQKYEKGANRISAGRMIQFAEKAWRGPGIFRRRLQRWFEGQWPYRQDGPRHRIDRRQQRGCGGVAGNGADEASARKFMVTLARTLRDTIAG